MSLGDWCCVERKRAASACVFRRHDKVLVFPHTGRASFVCFFITKTAGEEWRVPAFSSVEVSPVTGVRSFFIELRRETPRRPIDFSYPRRRRSERQAPDTFRIQKKERASFAGLRPPRKVPWQLSASNLQRPWTRVVRNASPIDGGSPKRGRRHHSIITSRARLMSHVQRPDLDETTPLTPSQTQRLSYCCCPRTNHTVPMRHTIRRLSDLSSPLCLGRALPRPPFNLPRGILGGVTDEKAHNT